MHLRQITLYLAAGMLLAAGPALAQGNPSADSIINQLRPGAGMQGGTRGLRPVAPAEAPAPSQATPAAMPHPAIHAATPAARAPAVHAPAAANAPSGTSAGAPAVNLTVQFANNSAELTPAAMRTLDELGTALTSSTLAAYKFRIEGHTDGVGNHDHNVVLSEQRAKAVVSYLQSKFHVDPARVEAVGLGPDQPLVPAAANAPEPRNRRVTVVNVGT